jgi:hypothetical protein
MRSMDTKLKELQDKIDLLESEKIAAKPKN